MGQVTRLQALATEIERDGSDPIRALFLTVLMHALRDSDAMRWLEGAADRAEGQLEGALDALNVTGANDNVSLKLKSSYGLALQAGVNIKLNETFGVHIMLSKMDIDTTGRVQVNGATVQSVDVNIDPYVAMIGLRWTL